MLGQTTARIVDFCARNRWLVIVLGLLLAAGSASFAISRFSINTDVETLISQDLPWRQRQLDLSKTFPQKGLLAVVEAPTPEGSEQATAALARELAGQTSLFSGVSRPDSGTFFEQSGLLFLPLPQVSQSMNGLATARPLIGRLAADPTLHGVMRALDLTLSGIQSGDVTLEQLRWPLQLANDTLDGVLAAKQPTLFSWRALTNGGPVETQELRHMIQAQPVLNFSALAPGKQATDAVEAAATNLKLGEQYGANVRLTGEVPLNDAQFSVVQTSAVRDTLIAAISVLVVLFLALRSWRIIVPVFFSLLVGLAATAALGIAMVGSFNLFSIAFFVLFVGIGVDFGIQFSVRYRSERHLQDNLFGALHSAAIKAGTPLALAAAATAVGFLAFLPTNYRGLSELGLIAGCGMLIAFFASITLVPAMLATLDPAAEPHPVGFLALKPLDEFLQRHRKVVIVLTFLAVLAGVPLLFQLRFDFDPINLQNPNTPAVLLYRELQSDPQIAAMNAAEVVAPNMQTARATAARLAALPEVSRILTAETLVPTDQEQKLAAIRTAADKLRPSLTPASLDPAATPEEVLAAMRDAANDLRAAAGSASGPTPQLARDLAQKLDKAAADPAAVARLESALVPTLKYDLERLRRTLDPQPVSVDTLPPDLKDAWVAPDGRARVEVLPKGNASDPSVLTAFSSSILNAEPTATGPAISYYESGNTVLHAFITAGAVALICIAILLWIALRRFTDVLLTLLPLILAGMVTLELAVLAGMQLNFANIIALPLLLGVGVAFKIYYTIAWRKGATNLLESPLTRAVVFSAATNAAAFGSMWASDYPGMSSMGKLMALALFCTMAFAVLFQPVLMGPPRNPDPNAEV